jgi:hypothetical protein
VNVAKNVLDRIGLIGTDAMKVLFANGLIDFEVHHTGTILPTVVLLFH